MDRIVRVVENSPSINYVVATVTAAVGWVNLMHSVQAFLGIVSLLIGIVVGVITLKIQLRKLKEENEKAIKRSQENEE